MNMLFLLSLFPPSISHLIRNARAQHPWIPIDQGICHEWWHCEKGAAQPMHCNLVRQRCSAQRMATHVSSKWAPSSPPKHGLQIMGYTAKFDWFADTFPLCGSTVQSHSTYGKYPQSLSKIPVMTFEQRNRIHHLERGRALQ